MSPRCRDELLAVFLATIACLAPAPGLGQIALPQASGQPLILQQPAQRVVALAPHLAELIYDAGAGDVLVGVTEYSNYPAAALDKPRIGDAFRFDLERILALRPDLIIAWDSGNPGAALDRLEQLGLRVWRTELLLPEGIATLLEQIASATGRPPPQSAESVRQKLRSLERTNAAHFRIRYFYQVAEKPLFTLNGAHLVSQGLARCGGENIFAQEPVLAPQVAHEAVLLGQPQVVFAPHTKGQPDPLAHWRKWPRMDAVRNEALVLLNADEISRATSRTLDSLAYACEQLDQVRRKLNKESSR